LNAESGLPKRRRPPIDPRPWHRHYEEGVPTSPELEDVTLAGYLDRAAERFPDVDATIFYCRRTSYARLRAQVDRFAAGLAALGVEKGDRVAVHLPNLPQTVVAILGAFRAGAVAVVTNPLYVAREIEHQWNDAGCKVAVTGDWLYAWHLQGIRNRLPVRHYVVCAIGDTLPFPLRQLVPLKLRRERPPLSARVERGPGIHVYRDFLAGAPRRPPAVPVDRDDVALLQYTGGTTGLAKGAMLTHHNLAAQVQQLAAWLPDLTPGEETFVAALPFFHIFGLTVALFLPLSVGARILLLPNPRDVAALVKGIRRHRATIFPAIPAFFNAINAYPGIHKIDLRCVTTCVSGSAPLPDEVLLRFEELTGGRICEGYGLTEASPVTHVNPLHGLRKIGSIGVPLPRTDARVIATDEPERELPAGEAGELLVRGPQVMTGYWENEEETRAVLRDGWLHTGDLAVRDEDGFFRLVGRKKDLIIVSGHNVYPEEIDTVLMAHPAVRESCTIGLPDPERGEKVKSYVVLEPGESATVEELVAWCRRDLAPYKKPREIEFRDELPKSAMMKLLRRVLREEEVGKRRP
jgi:long-chain acyl-CoA synthetase